MFDANWQPEIQSARVRNSYKVCVKAVNIKPNFSASLKKDILRWEPRSPVSQACAKEKNDWTQIALEHENMHESLTLDDIAKKNQTWNATGFQPEVCVVGPSPQQATEAAKAKLKEKVKARLESEVTQLRDTLSQKHRGLDNTHSVRAINCALCDPCHNCTLCERCMGGECKPIAGCEGGRCQECGGRYCCLPTQKCCDPFGGGQHCRDPRTC
jgi:hypothetical protein